VRRQDRPRSAQTEPHDLLGKSPPVERDCAHPHLSKTLDCPPRAETAPARNLGRLAGHAGPARSSPLLVQPEGFAKPRLKNSPQDCFCPPGRKRRAQVVRSTLATSRTFHTKQKEQHLFRCCSWCGPWDSNLWPLESENCDGQGNSMIQRQKLCGVHNFRRCLWWL